MKTGFFETTNYNLSAFIGGIELFPAEDKTKAKIYVPENDLITITLIREKNSEIEIKTRHQIFTGIFTEDIDLRDVYHDIRKHINKDVFYVEK
ncbi:MAG: hypothetical protein GXY49_02525 [Syntrophomonadaceae bacterium]|nr:hypothetical protein [Syntrophomonadaceae bacterium]